MQNINQMSSGNNEKQKLGYQYEAAKPSPNPRKRKQNQGIYNVMHHLNKVRYSLILFS